MTYDDAFMDGYYSAMEEFDSIDDDGLYDLDYFMPLDDDYSYEGYYDDEYDPVYEEETTTQTRKGSLTDLRQNTAVAAGAHHSSLVDNMRSGDKLLAAQVGTVAGAIGAGALSKHLYKKSKEIRSKQGTGIIKFLKKLFAKIKLFIYKIVPNFIKKAVGGDPTKGKRDPLLKKLENDTKDLTSVYKRYRKLADMLNNASFALGVGSVAIGGASVMSYIRAMQEKGEVNKIRDAYKKAESSYLEARKSNPNASVPDTGYTAASQTELGLNKVTTRNLDLSGNMYKTTYR